MNKVLILDANLRSSLAVTRSLGKKGIPVLTADETPKTLAGASKYNQQSLVYPSPYYQTEQFISTLKDFIQQHNIEMLFPMSEVSCSTLLKHKEQFPNTCIPFASFESFDFLSNKSALFKLAKSLNIPIPKTYFINKPEDLEPALQTLSFPVVLKPSRSRIKTANGWIPTRVAIADNFDEVNRLIKSYDYFKSHPFMLQSYITGVGQGTFALYKNGKPLCFFSHKRLKEKPPSGGVSVLCESAETSNELLQSTRTLLDHVKWDGIAMVEFKVDPKGTPYLMEINARFWGSLQLAIDCNIDFPFFLFQIFSNQSPIIAPNYPIGKRLRWLLGDLDRIFIILKSKKISLSTKLKETIKFFKLFEPNMRYEVNRLSDFKPFIFEIREYIKTNFISRSS